MSEIRLRKSDFKVKRNSCNALGTRYYYSELLLTGGAAERSKLRLRPRASDTITHAERSDSLRLFGSQSLMPNC